MKAEVVPFPKHHQAWGGGIMRRRTLMPMLDNNANLCIIGQESSSVNRRQIYPGVCTLATIYSVGSAGEGENIETIKTKMANETYADGTKVFTLASGISLLLFYAFAMQCMSTLAIVRRETKTWKWPILQLIGMTAIAYICALIAFQILK